MVVLGLEIGADSLTVVILQTFRVIVSMSLYPLVAKLLLKRQPAVALTQSAANGEQQGPINYGKLAASLAFSVVGGLLLSALKVPAGAMIGSLAFMVVANMLGFGEQLSSPLLLGLLLTAVGMGVADSITPETISAILSGTMLWTLVVTLFISFLSSGLLTIIVHKLTGWDWVTCIFGLCSCGSISMPIIAMEINVDPLPISLFAFVPALYNKGLCTHYGCALYLKNLPSSIRTGEILCLSYAFTTLVILWFNFSLASSS